MLSLTLASCGDKYAQSDRGLGAEANWLAAGGSADAASYSQLELVTPSNVNKLGLAWSLDLPDEVTLEATPLAIDGTLYFSGSDVRP